MASALVSSSQQTEGMSTTRCRWVVCIFRVLGYLRLWQHCKSDAACDFSGMMPILLSHLCTASCPRSHALQEGPFPIISTIAINERACTFAMQYHLHRRHELRYTGCQNRMRNFTPSFITIFPRATATCILEIYRMKDFVMISNSNLEWFTVKLKIKPVHIPLQELSVTVSINHKNVTC